MKPSFITAAFLLGPVVALNAYSEVYMTETQAAQAMFPGLKLEKHSLILTPEEQEQITKLSGEKVRSRSVTYWSFQKACVLIDQVLGKHEMITFAVAIDPSSKIKSIEILEYRESYGQEVKNEKWRAQFVGKDKLAPLKVDQDIQNLSGATLSSAHVTAGVRRLLQTYDVIKARI